MGASGLPWRVTRWYNGQATSFELRAGDPLAAVAKAVGHWRADGQVLAHLLIVERIDQVA